MKTITINIVCDDFVINRVRTLKIFIKFIEKKYPKKYGYHIYY